MSTRHLVRVEKAPALCSLCGRRGGGLMKRVEQELGRILGPAALDQHEPETPRDERIGPNVERLAVGPSGFTQPPRGALAVPELRERLEP
ncbi:hypothetical protein [Polyangium jinanense]|uniref:Uncharacterized protein n=1 Tax=Polyangium jinanense TaxID=2829994 RepID=A0A9X4AX15_9BACT|nr:hypothetical protein [Polyangium jinanense]MDC3987919.1 hypothetical protein [Polyangium jinanense]